MVSEEKFEYVKAIVRDGELQLEWKLEKMNVPGGWTYRLAHIKDWSDEDIQKYVADQLQCPASLVEVERA